MEKHLRALSLCIVFVAAFSGCTPPGSSPSGDGGAATLPDPLYVTNNGSSDGANGISAYTIGPGGALSSVTTGTFATGACPWGVSISP